MELQQEQEKQIGGRHRVRLASSISASLAKSHKKKKRSSELIVIKSNLIGRLSKIQIIQCTKINKDKIINIIHLDIIILIL